MDFHLCTESSVKRDGLFKKRAFFIRDGTCIDYQLSFRGLTAGSQVLQKSIMLINSFIMKITITIISILLSLAGGLYFIFFHSSHENSTVFTKADSVNVDWELLRSLDVTSENIPKDLRLLSGMQIKIPGFIIPLEDNQDTVREFLFVPSPMACIHVPPPPPNQIIHVKMASGKLAKMSYGPVWLFGKLIIAENAGKKIRNSYEMVGIAAEPYQ